MGYTVIFFFMVLNSCVFLQKANAFNGLVRYYLNDSINPETSFNSLMQLFENEHNINAKYSLAFLYLEQENWSIASTIMNNIPSAFELTDDELDNHNQMLIYYNLLMDMAQNNISIDDLSETQMATLSNMNENPIGRSSVFARNILLTLNATDYDEPIILPDLLKSSEAETDYHELLDKINEAPQYIVIHPNPAKDYVIVEYTLEKEGDAVIEVHDMNGNKHYSKPLSNKNDQLVIDTRNFRSGIYICTLKIDKKLLESEKFTIID